MLTCLECSGIAPLCAGCVSAKFDQLRGVAACRGHVWANDVARRVPVGRVPWPEWDRSVRVRLIAARKCEDLSRDLVLLDLLARACHTQAARTWGDLAAAAVAEPLAAAH